MKTYKILLTLIISPLFIFSQFTKDDFFSNKKNVVFTGLDFSEARFIGSSAFSKTDVVQSLLTDWNKLIFKESEKKYNLREALNAGDFEFDISITNKNNSEIEANERIIDKSYSLDIDKLTTIVKNYEIETKEGIGVSFIVESFNKVKEKAFVYVTFFDLKTRNITYKELISTDPGGFGYKNYWANSIHNIINIIEKDSKYEKLIIKHEIPYYHYGLDFSETRFIGENKFDYINNIEAYYLDEWNSLLMIEKNKFNLGAFLGIEKWDVNTNIVRINNDLIKVSERVIDNSYQIEDKNFQPIINNYNIDNKKGIGATFIIEAFNKTTNTGTAHLVLFDLVTKKILITKEYNGEAGGIGLRNFWDNSILKMMEQIKKKDFKEELKEYDYLLFCGLDFSKARFIGSKDFSYLTDIESNFLKEWNKLLLNSYNQSERKLKLRDINFKSDYSNKFNEIKVSDDKIIASSNNFSFSSEDIKNKMLAKYTFKEDNGIGILYFIETLDASNNQITAYIVIFDIKTKNILITDTLTGKAKRGDFKNIWEKAFKKTAGDIEDKYDSWK